MPSTPAWQVRHVGGGGCMGACGDDGLRLQLDCCRALALITGARALPLAQKLKRRAIPVQSIRSVVWIRRRSV
jgi:hypothetical protein